MLCSHEMSQPHALTSFVLASMTLALFHLRETRRLQYLNHKVHTETQAFSLSIDFDLLFGIKENK